MGEKGAAASEHTPSTSGIPSSRGLGILVAGATAPRHSTSGADRGQGGQGGGQFCPGPSGTRASSGVGARAAPAAQHQQEADSLPQVEMIAAGQRPVPARVSRQLGARRQRYGREVHRVVTLGLHGVTRTGTRRRRTGGPAGVGAGAAHKIGPARGDPEPRTPRHRMTGERPEAEGRGRGLRRPGLWVAAQGGEGGRRAAPGRRQG